MGPDEAESAACGRSPCKDDNEVWPHFRRNPKDALRIAVSLVAKIRPVFVTPRSLHSRKLAPVAAVLEVKNRLQITRERSRASRRNPA